LTTVGAVLPSADFSVSVNGAGTVLTIHQISTGLDVLQVSLTNTTDGSYTVTQLNPIDHPAGNDENNLAFTINYVEEGIGVARACRKAGIPSVISFTVETDGRLPSGQTIRDAIEQTDRDTGNAPAYYMLNCAHPTHFADALRNGEAWVARLRGLRANASTRSHAELDTAPDLDIGDPVDLGRRYGALRRQFGHFCVLGGCCGTDHRHVEQISLACVPVAA